MRSCHLAPLNRGSRTAYEEQRLEDRVMSRKRKLTVSESNDKKGEIEKREMRKEVEDSVTMLGPETSKLIEEYRKIGRCYICGRSQKRKLDRDHHHGSKRLRGLLCRSCNLALGLINNDPETAKAIAEYLHRQPILGDSDMLDFDS
jgi:Recombination endonuclease VII